MQSWISWISWLVLTGIVIILELFSGTFYLLMIAIGLAAGALVALLGLDSSTQLIVAAVVGAGATIILHKSKFGWKKTVDATRDPNVNMDIGQKISVAEWHENGAGKFVARVMYRGALWDVELHAKAAQAGEFTISEIQGSRLILKTQG